MVYSDVHRALLNVCAYRGTIKVPEAIEILKSIYDNSAEQPQQINEENLRSFVQQINRKLYKLEQKLVFVVFEMAEVQFEALVFANSNMSKEIVYSTAVTESEAKYFKKLIYSIASSDTFSVSTMQAIHFSSDYKITKQNAQQLLNEWSEKGYLNETADSFQLGPRTIGEFGDALHQIHDGLRNCSMCRQILFNGIVCPHGCECIMHKICTEKYFKTGKRCLVCKKEWNKNENKEDTAKETQPKRRSRRNKNNES